MTELPAVALLQAAAAATRADAALLQAEIARAALDALLASPLTTATVAGRRSPEGALILMTSKGQVVLPNGPDLPPGTEVELRLVGRSPPLVTVKPLAAAPAPVAPAARIVRGTPLPAVLLAAPAADPRAPGTTLLVRILEVALPASAAPSAPRDAIHTRIGGLDLPAPNAPSSGSAAAPGARPTPAEIARALNAAGALAESAAVPAVPRDAANPATPSATTGLAAAPDAPATGPGAALRPVATNPSPSLPSMPVAGELRVDGELVGPVVTRTTAGAVIATPHHTIAVEGLDAPEGALIRFVLLEPAMPAPARPTRRVAWSSLGDALRALETSAPETAERLAGDFNPRETPRLAASIRLIAAALRDESIPWPGKAVEEALVKAGHAEFVPALRDEARTLARVAGEPASQWQILPLPIHDGAQLTPAFLYVERDTRRDAKNGDEQRRFVLDVQTRTLGQLQLDGLLRPKRFDLLLRSRVPPDRVMRREIETIFRATLDSAGWTGEVAFSTTPAFPNEPAGKLRERVAAMA